MNKQYRGNYTWQKKSKYAISVTIRSKQNRCLLAPVAAPIFYILIMRPCHQLIKPFIPGGCIVLKVNMCGLVRAAISAAVNNSAGGNIIFSLPLADIMGVTDGKRNTFEISAKDGKTNKRHPIGQKNGKYICALCPV